MPLSDKRILEYVYEEESGSSEKIVDNRIRFSRAHLSRRCKKLVDYDLLKHLGSGVYVITDESGRYLICGLETTKLKRMIRNQISVC